MGRSCATSAGRNTCGGNPAVKTANSIIVWWQKIFSAAVKMLLPCSQFRGCFLCNLRENCFCVLHGSVFSGSWRGTIEMRVTRRYNRGWCRKKTLLWRRFDGWRSEHYSGPSGRVRVEPQIMWPGDGVCGWTLTRLVKTATTTSLMFMDACDWMWVQLWNKD